MTAKNEIDNTAQTSKNAMIEKEYEVYSKNRVSEYFDDFDFDLAMEKMYSLNKETGHSFFVLDRKCAVVCSVYGDDYTPTMSAIDLEGK